MKISLEWLQSFTPGARYSAPDLAEALTNGGLNVESVAAAGDDAVLDVEVTSNRGDCLCHVGVAREAAALLNKPFQFTETAGNWPGEACIPVEIESERRCPLYTARLIRGVKIAPSPEWLANRLTRIGLRPINNVVDVTNYVLMEMGQPLHAFDFAHLNGGRIVVRNARSGETIQTLDGHAQRLQPTMLVIADASRPLAIAGIMGGSDSQVTEVTKDILLESAVFDALYVRRTSRALALRSDSSYRFERGIDPTLPARASARATQLILETAGGTVVGGIAWAGIIQEFEPRVIQLRLSRLAGLLGMEVPRDQVIGALSRLQLNPVLDGESVRVTIPSWRLDLNMETDLIEEVARLIGYDSLPVRREIAIRLQPPEPSAAVIETIRQTLVAAGFFEAVTFSFVSDALKDDFFPPGAAPLRADATVRKADATLRPSILPGLLEAVRRNEANGTPDAHLFEIGSVFLAGASGKPDEKRTVAFAGGADWRELRGVVEILLARLDAEKGVRFIPDEKAGFERGAGARIEWNSKPVGFAGRIAGATAEKLSLREPPYGCELDLNALLAGAVSVAKLKPLPQFPPAPRDLSLIVDESIPYERIEQALRKPNPANLEEIEYVTTYRGKPLEAGKKSVTVTLVFRSDAGTLTGDQVESSVASVVAAATSELGATLRQ